MSDDESDVSIPSSAASQAASMSSEISSGSDFESGPAKKKSKREPETATRAAGKKAAPARSRPVSKLPAAPPRPVAHADRLADQSAVSNGKSAAIAAKIPPTPAILTAPPAVLSAADVTQGPAVASESAARKLILQYMKQQNRSETVDAFSPRR